MVVSIGNVLNQRYRIVRLLGHGGFGAVYRAWDQNLNVPCALKENFDISEEAARQFSREAQILASLRHPNLPRVTDHFYVPDQGQYLVMEFIEGEDLNEKRINYGGPQPLEQVLVWLYQILDALEYLHSQNPPIVHRDIKPANIRITPQRQAFLVDFGIAKIFDPQLKTNAGARAITHGFSPIEQYGEGTTDPRSDIYALGATVYSLLSGKVPPESILRTLEDQLLPLDEINQQVPAFFSNSIHKAMQLKPSDRWQSVEEMKESLKSGPLPVIVTEPASQTASMISTTPMMDIGETGKPLEKSQKESSDVSPVKEIRQSISSIGKMDKKPEKSHFVYLMIGGGIVSVILLIVAVFGFFFSYMKPNAPSGSAKTVTSISIATQNVVEINKPIKTELMALPPPEPIRLGLLAPISGRFPQFGISVHEGVRLAVDQWNQRNGVLGRQIELLVADTSCEAESAIAETNRLIEKEGVRYIIGEVCSNASIPVSEIVNEKKVLQISPMSTNPLVTQDALGNTKHFTFRDCFIDSFQGRVMAKFSIEKGFRSAFVIMDRESDYSMSMSEAFITSFTDFGGEIVGTSLFESGQEDFSKILVQIANSNARIVFIPAFYDVVNRIGRQIKDQKLDVVMAGGDGWESPDLDLNAVEGGFFSTHFNPLDTSPSVRAWVELYGHTYKSASSQSEIPDAIATLGYESANILFTAIEKTGSDDPFRVADILSKSEFVGVSGPIRFDEYHNPVKAAVIMGVQDGSLRFIQTILP